MADNRERARALMEKECPTCGQVAIYSGGEYRPLDEEDTPDPSRGSASIADEATVERVRQAIGDSYVEGKPIRATTVKDWLCPRDLTLAAEAALAAIPAPPAPLKDRKT